MIEVYWENIGYFGGFLIFSVFLLVLLLVIAFGALIMWADRNF